MRGSDEQQAHMFSYLSPEARVPKDHPLRPIRRMVNQALKELSGEFERMYADTGRRSIPPEHLIRALLLQILYSVRSERLLMEQLDYNLLFRWFVGLNLDDQVWHPTTFTKNRDRFLRSEFAADLLRTICALARDAGLLSDEHFSVDGTLLAGVGLPEERTPQGGRSSLRPRHRRAQPHGGFPRGQARQRYPYLPHGPAVAHVS